MKLGIWNIIGSLFFSAGLMGGLAGCQTSALSGYDGRTINPNVLTGAFSFPGATQTNSYCGDTYSGRVCLSLKFVTYKDSEGNSTVSNEEMISNMKGINSLWEQCGIDFIVDKFQAVEPSEYGLRYNTANDYELNEIRKNFMEDSNLLVVVTGKWDRTGSLGYTAANAWTNLPGDSMYGAILESTVGAFPNIIAHELGHYLNLNHVSNSWELMNPIIYENSNTISQYQCEIAKSAILSYWEKMIRKS